jgi:Putative peptidoglycan binding domain
MRNTIPNRVGIGARIRAIAGTALLVFCLIVVCLMVPSKASFADSSVAPSTPTPKTPAKPVTTQSKTAGDSSSGSATTHKKTTHRTTKNASHKSTGQKTGQQTAASRGKKSSKSQRTSRKRGQQAIDRDRARAIQEALIREHYLEGAPSGTWDATTQAAMQRYQADQGWQSKTTPDSRALIKLGLGPSNDHLLNPESAMTTTPAAGDPKAATKANPAQNNQPHQ